MLENYKTILVSEECADILRVSIGEIYKMLKNDILKRYKVGKTWRIPKANIIAYIASKTI